MWAQEIERKGKRMRFGSMNKHMGILSIAWEASYEERYTPQNTQSDLALSSAYFKSGSHSDILFKMLLKIFLFVTLNAAGEMLLIRHISHLGPGFSVEFHFMSNALILMLVLDFAEIYVHLSRYRVEEFMANLKRVYLSIIFLLIMGLTVLKPTGIESFFFSPDTQKATYSEIFAISCDMLSIMIVLSGLLHVCLYRCMQSPRHTGADCLRLRLFQSLPLISCMLWIILFFYLNSTPEFGMLANEISLSIQVFLLWHLSMSTIGTYMRISDAVLDLHKNIMRLFCLFNLISLTIFMMAMVVNCDIRTLLTIHHIHTLFIIASFILSIFSLIEIQFKTESILVDGRW